MNRITKITSVVAALALVGGRSLPAPRSRFPTRTA